MAGGPISNVMPVFPLNTVVFPRMPLPLHIFEERYRQMVKDLQETGGRFCVALIKEGVEVGGEATPHNVGCAVEVAHAKQLPDGRHYLVTLGVERVRIASLDRSSKPYLLGTVEAWPDERATIAPPLLHKAARLFTEYARYRVTLLGEHPGDFALPGEPDLLSYVLATVIDLEADERQRLLEAPDAVTRIRAEMHLLERELPSLRAIVAASRPPDVESPFSRN
ncbi:MAG: LON peptidase substrate-binding domain-containing protein [Chloroflexota bacterium]|nr:LON peptidase substrate-binding domain-containing protein [Chloroflexota bacterium]